MKSTLVMSMLLGLFATAASAATCERPPQVQRLHGAYEFDMASGIDIATAPGHLPLITFYGQLAGDPEHALWLHRCLDEACSPGATARLANVNFSGMDTTAMLRADGRPLVANVSQGWPALFDCSDAACSTGINRVLMFGGGLLEPRAELRGDGRPVLAYVDQFQDAVVVAACDDAACNQPESEAVVAITTMALPSIEMALTSDHRPVLAVTSFGDGAPYTDLVICESPACEAPVTRRIVDDYGYWLAVDVRSDDRVVMHYAPSLGPSKLVVCNDATCTAPQTQTLAGFSSTGMLLAAGNLPILEVATGGVGFYRCETEDCSVQGDYQDLATTPNGATMAMARGANGEPVVAFTNVGNSRTFAAACSATAIASNGFEPGLDATPAAN